MSSIDAFMDRMYWQERTSSALDGIEGDWRRRAAAENLSYRDRHGNPADILAERAEIDKLLADFKVQQLGRSLLRQSGKQIFDFSKVDFSAYPGVYPFSKSSETESSD